MLLADNVGVHDPGGGVEGVHCWVDAQLRDCTREHSGGVKVGKGGGRGWISQVISRHVDGLVGGANTCPVILLRRMRQIML